MEPARQVSLCIGQQSIARRQRLVVALRHTCAIARLLGELEEWLERIQEQSCQRIKSCQLLRRRNALVAAIADHAPHDFAILLLDLGLIVLTNGR